MTFKYEAEFGSETTQLRERIRGSQRKKYSNVINQFFGKNKYWRSRDISWNI